MANNRYFLEKYLTQQQQIEFHRQVTYQPYAGRVVFQIGNCPACWIKGGWSKKTFELANDFIDNQGLIGFLRDV